MSSKKPWVLTIGICLLLSARSALSAGPIRILYSNDRQGEVGPCECSGPQVGGLERLANAVAKERDGGDLTLLVDSGDSFFSLPALPPTKHDNALTNARTIADAYAALGFAAMTPGERDLALGLDVYRELAQRSGTQVVSANLRGSNGALLFAPQVVIPIGGQKVGVIGVSGPEALGSVAGLRVDEPTAAVRTEVEKLRSSKVDLVVLLSHAGLVVDRELAKIPGIDAIVGAHSLDALRKPEGSAQTAIVQAMPRGQELGVLVAKGGPHRLVLLDAQWRGPNRVTRLISAAKQNKTSKALAEKTVAAPTGRPKDAFVANAFVCKNCHAEQHAFWEKTKHASAYLVLYAKDQPYDPDCIGCHTLGYTDRRGFKARAGTVVLGDDFKSGQEPFVETLMKTVFASDPGKGPLDSRKEPDRYAKLKAKYHESTAELMEKKNLRNLYLGVQCEHCHGNRAGHPQTKVTKTKIEPALCKNCHDSTHHPAFNFAAMRPQIACPKIKRH